MPFAAVPFVGFFAECRGQRRPTGCEQQEVRHFLFPPADLKPGGAGTYKLAHEWDTRGEQFGSDNGLFFICIARCSTPAVPPPPLPPFSCFCPYGDSFINTGTGARETYAERPHGVMVELEPVVGGTALRHRQMA